MRRRNKIRVVIVILVVLFFGYKKVTTKSAAASVATVAVKRDTVFEKITETGNVNAVGKVSVFSTTTGVVDQLFVSNGNPVMRGQKLFHVRATATDQDKAAAYAAYLTAVNAEKTADQNTILYQSQLEAARKAIIDAQNGVDTMNSNRSQSYPNPSTHNQYTQNDIDSINSALTSAREAFSQAEKKYVDAGSGVNAAKATQTSDWLAYQATKDSTITAPADGDVSNLSVSEGDAVTANSNIAGSTITSSSTSTLSPVLYITNLQKFTVVTQVNEVDVPKLTVDQKVSMTFDAIPNASFSGTINKIDDVGTNTSGVITYNVYLTIDNLDPKIKSGMTTNIEIETARHQNVLTVPNNAIKQSKNGKTVDIFNPKTKTSKTVTVQLGLRGDLSSEVLSGVKNGDLVVIPGPSTAKAGGFLSGLRPGGSPSTNKGG